MASVAINGLPKHNRLITAGDYKCVFSKPNKVSTSSFLFLYCLNVDGISRLGLAIAKKKIPLAVDRNRLKRHIRESFRQQQRLCSIDVVVMVRKNVLQLNNQQLKAELEKLWSQIVRTRRQ